MMRNTVLMMIRIFFLCIVTIVNSAIANSELKIYLGESDKAPYHIHSPGHIYANVNLMVLGQLIQSEDGFEIKPGLLDSFRFDFGKKIYILKLKKDLKFHNGRSVNSKDLEFTLLRGFYSSDKSFFHTYLGNIKGVDKIKKGDRFKSGSVLGVRIIDDLTVHIELVGPNPSLFHSLSAPYFSLVPMEELKDDYLTWRNYPVGAGDYAISEKFDGEKTVLSKSNPKAKFDKVTLISKLSSKEKVDISFEKIENTRAEYSKLPVCVRVFDFSNKHKLGQDDNFKKVFNYLMKEVEFDDSPFAKKSTGILPSHFWGQAKVEKQDLEINDLINKLKLKDLEVIVFAGAELSSKHLYYIEKIKKVFAKYKVEITFRTNSEKFVSEKTASKYPVRFWGIVSDYVDPLIMYSAYRKIGHNLNYSPTGEILSRYENIYLEAERAETFEKRLQSVRKLNLFSQENLVQVPLAEEKMIYYVDDKSVVDLGNQVNPLFINVNKILMK